MKKQFIAYLVVSALCSGLASGYFLSQPEVDWFTVTGAAATLPILFTQIGSLWYFLTSLSVFQRKLKIAYYFLAAGLFLFGLAQMQLPLTLLIGTIAPDFDYTLLQLLLLIPYSFGTLVMYIAMRKFAKLLQVKSLWNSAWFAIGFALVSAAGAALLPEQPTPDVDPVQINMLFAFVGWGAGFAAAATAATIQIKAVIGDAYKRALSWMVAALGVLAFAYYHLIISQTLGSFLGSAYESYLTYNISLVPFLIASVLFLRAGQRFKMVSRQYTAALSEKANELDVVVYAAQLVSNPRAIEDTLAKVRELTATRAGQTELSAKEKTSLKDIYLKLENYLTTQEPLRKITREGLRERLPLSFQQSLGA